MMDAEPLWSRELPGVESGQPHGVVGHTVVCISVEKKKVLVLSEDNKVEQHNKVELFNKVENIIQ